MAKYLVMLRDKTGHKVHSLKRAVALSQGQSFVAQKLLREGRKSKWLRKYEVLGKMVHCVATKEI